MWFILQVLRSLWLNDKALGKHEQNFSITEIFDPSTFSHFMMPDCRLCLRDRLLRCMTVNMYSWFTLKEKAFLSRTVHLVCCGFLALFHSSKVSNTLCLLQMQGSRCLRLFFFSDKEKPWQTLATKGERGSKGLSGAEYRSSFYKADGL